MHSVWGQRVLNQWWRQGPLSPYSKTWRCWLSPTGVHVVKALPLLALVLQQGCSAEGSDSSIVMLVEERSQEGCPGLLCTSVNERTLTAGEGCKHKLIFHHSLSLCPPVFPALCRPVCWYRTRARERWDAQRSKISASGNFFFFGADFFQSNPVAVLFNRFCCYKLNFIRSMGILIFLYLDLITAWDDGTLLAIITRFIFWV